MSCRNCTNWQWIPPLKVYSPRFWYFLAQGNPNNWDTNWVGASSAAWDIPRLPPQKFIRIFQNFMNKLWIFSMALLQLETLQKDFREVLTEHRAKGEILGWKFLLLMFLLKGVQKVSAATSWETGQFLEHGHCFDWHTSCTTWEEFSKWDTCKSGFTYNGKF